MIDLAPGWQIRCPHCNRHRPLGDFGAIRIGAYSIGKRTLTWCTKCRRTTWAVIERLPQEADDKAPKAEQLRCATPSPKWPEFPDDP